MPPQVAEKADKKSKWNPLDNIPPHRRSLGRPKGAMDARKRTMQEALMLAGEIAGNDIVEGSGLVGYLHHLAMNKPELYVSMLAKIIPLQVSGTASDGALEIRWLPPQEPPKVIEHEEE
jgi:hypothetical protein